MNTLNLNGIYLITSSFFEFTFFFIFFFSYSYYLYSKKKNVLNISVKKKIELYFTTISFEIYDYCRKRFGQPAAVEPFQFLYVAPQKETTRPVLMNICQHCIINVRNLVWKELRKNRFRLINRIKFNDIVIDYVLNILPTFYY